MSEHYSHVSITEKASAIDRMEALVTASRIKEEKERQKSEENASTPKVEEIVEGRVWPVLFDFPPLTKKAQPS
jgi:hypothetical protein